MNGKPLDQLQYWVQQTLPQVYDDSLSFYELLNKVIFKLNECVDLTNTTSERIEQTVFDQLQVWLTNGTFDGIINESIFEDLNNEIKSMTDEYTVNLYVSLNGNDSNDGLSLGTSFLTISKAMSVIKQNAHRMEKGHWIVNVGGGIYKEPTIVLDTPSNYNILIKGVDVGGHPNVPVTVIDGLGGGDYVHGMNISGMGVKATVKDIKFTNFTGSSGANRGGLLFDNGADGFTDNVHADNCSWFGIYISRRSQGRIKGGIINNCKDGIYTDGAKITIGYGATNLSTGTLISNCTEGGVYVARGTDGHIDYCTISDCNVGINIESNSRVDCVGDSLKRNLYGIRTQNGGYYTDNAVAPINFNIGTPDANTYQDKDYKAFGGESTENSDGSTEIRLAFDRVTRSLTGTTPTVLSTPYTLKANRLKGIGKSLRVVSTGVYTVTANSVLTVKIGGLTLPLTVSGAVTSGTFWLEVILHEVQGGYRAFGTLRHGMATSRTGSTGSGFVVGVDNPITVECALTGASDSVTLYRTDIYAIG